ncbi:hypothetical protein BV25DRAFT_1726591 [Artomyces pyxidatus]|uniref:Uncharacterized protein n=1 Tax=Artomyces pyxidatus TaxID=48021 RepID=A0ACB8SIJ5_9AGAM|nr:hypothetical protein BV25DRAFT_1726591 [Artomyces pyxidatus]
MSAPSIVVIKPVFTHTTLPSSPAPDPPLASRCRLSRSGSKRHAREADKDHNRCLCSLHQISFHNTRIGRALQELPADVESCCPTLQLLQTRCLLCKPGIHQGGQQLMFSDVQAKDCQRAHWRRHRGYCKSITADTKLFEASTVRALQVRYWCEAHESCVASAVASAMRMVPRGPKVGECSQPSRLRATSPADAGTERHACLLYLAPTDVLVDTPAWEADPSLPVLPFKIGAVRAAPLSEIYTLMDTLVARTARMRTPMHEAQARSLSAYRTDMI